MDDPIAREMMDMAIRYIGFRDEASELSAALKKSEKHAEELEAKLKAAEEVFKGARAQATTKEEEWEEEKSKMATRERLEAFNASIIKFASGPSRQESMPEESSTSEAADPTTQSSKPSPGTGGTHHFEELQSELRILKDQIVVALSKVKRAAKREDYLLDLIFRASDDLLCVQLNPVTETERIKARMNVHMEISVGTGSDFWTDHKRCFNIVQLQDRVSQVSEFVEFRRSVLAMIYNTMFPRNPEPQGFAELVGKFKHAEDIHYFVKIQLVAGAKLALAWVRVH